GDACCPAFAVPELLELRQIDRRNTVFGWTARPDLHERYAVLGKSVRGHSTRQVSGPAAATLRARPNRPTSTVSRKTRSRPSGFPVLDVPFRPRRRRAGIIVSSLRQPTAGRPPINGPQFKR